MKPAFPRFTSAAYSGTRTRRCLVDRAPADYRVQLEPAAMEAAFDVCHPCARQLDLLPTSKRRVESFEAATVLR